MIFFRSGTFRLISLNLTEKPGSKLACAGGAIFSTEATVYKYRITSDTTSHGPVADLQSKAIWSRRFRGFQREVVLTVQEEGQRHETFKISI